MVHAGIVVADRFGRSRTQKHGARVSDVAQAGPWVPHQEFDVFRGDTIGQPDAFAQVLHHHNRTEVAQGLSDGVAAVQAGDLPFDFVRDPPGEVDARRDADGGFEAAAVFGLGQQVRGDVSGVGGFVGQNDDFAGAGDHVDIDGSEDQLFRDLDGGVAGAHEFVHPGDGGGAVGQGGNGLGAENPVDFIDADDMGGSQHGRMDGAVRPCRRGHAESRHARDAGGNGGHQKRREKRGARAGDENANPFDGEHPSAQHHAVAVFDVPGGLFLRAVKPPDVVRRGRDGLDQFRIRAPVGGFDVRRGYPHPVGRKVHAVELPGVFQNRVVPACPHGPDNLLHGGQQLGLEIGGPGKNGLDFSVRFLRIVGDNVDHQ